MAKPIDVRTASYFSTNFKFAGGILGFTGALLVSVNIYIGLAMFIAGVAVLTTHYRLSIDFDKRSYHDYTWFLGLKIGDRGTFETIQCIFVNKTRVSETVYARVASTTILRDEFNGYLRFSERHKIHLGSDESKADMLNRMSNIAIMLKCDMLDYTNS